MKRNIMLLGGLLLAVAIGIVCSGLVVSGREFSSIEPHVQTAGDETAVPIARNYTELKNQVIGLVENAQTQGTIQLKDYTADVENELARVCNEVVSDTPIGAYAVDMMSIDHTRVMGYYNVKVNISYKRSREEILNIYTASGNDELKEVIKDAIAERRATFAVKCDYYAEQVMNVAAAVRELRLSEPWAVYGIEDVKVQTFPLSGLHRILLVEVGFYESAEESELKRNRAQQQVMKIVEETKELFGGERVREICSRISQGVESTDAGADADTPYGALVSKRASDLGLAVAVKQVLAEFGMYAVVVEGSLDGMPHFWNMAFAEKSWEHIDLSRGIVLEPNEKMTGYTWDDMKYPADMSHLRNNKAS